MSFPQDAVTFLVKRGQLHFKDISKDVCKKAAELILGERAKQEENLVKPGAAEYLDILRALDALCKGDKNKQEQALSDVAQFSLFKTPESKS